MAKSGRSVVLIDPQADAKNPPLTEGWVPAALVETLGLARQGWKEERADPWIETPALTLWRDVARSSAAIAKLSPRDAAKWPAFCDTLHALARVLEHIYS